MRTQPQRLCLPLGVRAGAAHPDQMPVIMLGHQERPASVREGSQMIGVLGRPLPPASTAVLRAQGPLGDRGLQLGWLLLSRDCAGLASGRRQLASCGGHCRGRLGIA
jgi:hypothetical protein